MEGGETYDRPIHVPDMIPLPRHTILDGVSLFLASRNMHFQSKYHAPPRITPKFTSQLTKVSIATTHGLRSNTIRALPSIEIIESDDILDGIKKGGDVLDGIKENNDVPDGIKENNDILDEIKEGGDEPDDLDSRIEIFRHPQHCKNSIFSKESVSEVGRDIDTDAPTCFSVIPVHVSAQSYSRNTNKIKKEEKEEDTDYDIRVVSDTPAQILSTEDSCVPPSSKKHYKRHAIITQQSSQISYIPMTATSDLSIPLIYGGNTKCEAPYYRILNHVDLPQCVPSLFVNVFSDHNLRITAYNVDDGACFITIIPLHDRCTTDLDLTMEPFSLVNASTSYHIADNTSRQFSMRSYISSVIMDEDIHISQSNIPSVSKLVKQQFSAIRFSCASLIQSVCDRANGAKSGPKSLVIIGYKRTSTLAYIMALWIQYEMAQDRNYRHYPHQFSSVDFRTLAFRRFHRFSVMMIDEIPLANEMFNSIHRPYVYVNKVSTKDSESSLATGMISSDETSGRKVDRPSWWRRCFSCCCIARTPPPPRYQEATTAPAHGHEYICVNAKVQNTSDMMRQMETCLFERGLKTKRW